MCSSDPCVSLRAVGGSPGRLGGDTGGSLPGQLDIGEIARALPRLWAPLWMWKYWKQDESNYGKWHMYSGFTN